MSKYSQNREEIKEPLDWRPITEIHGQNMYWVNVEHCRWGILLQLSAQATVMWCYNPLAILYQQKPTKQRIIKYNKLLTSKRKWGRSINSLIDFYKDYKHYMSDCSKHKAILLVNKNHYEVSRYCIDAA